MDYYCDGTSGQTRVGIRHTICVRPASQMMIIKYAKPELRALKLGVVNEDSRLIKEN